MAIAHFYPSEEIKDKCLKVFREESSKILEKFPSVDIQHIGASSVPGALTLGDLDIQIRVEKENYDEVKEYLSTIYYPNHPYLWDEGFSIFHKKDHPELPISIALTVIDTKYDEYANTRDILISDFNLLSQYNQLKKDYEGKNILDYKKAKDAFWGGNGKNRFL